MGLVCLGLFTRFHAMQFNMAGYEWVPVASFAFAILAANFGILTLPFLVMTEILPDKVNYKIKWILHIRNIGLINNYLFCRYVRLVCQ